MKNLWMLIVWLSVVISTGAQVRAPSLGWPGYGATDEEVVGSWSADDGVAVGASWNEWSYLQTALSQIGTMASSGAQYNFDGIDDALNLGLTNSAQLGTTYSLSCWVKPDSVTGTHEMITNRDNPGANSILFFLRSVATNLEFVVRGAAVTPVIGIASNVNALTVGQWHHCVAVRNGNTIQVYVNNTAGISDTQSFGAILNIRTYMGAAFQLGVGTEWFDGLIDDAVMYRLALSTAQIRQLYEQGKPFH